MRLILLLSLLLHSGLDLSAQVSNSWSSDKTGMYFNSIDTLVKIISKEKRIDRVFMSTRDLTKNLQEMPNNVSGIKILKTDQIVNGKDLTNQDIYLGNFDIQINQDEVSIMMIVYHAVNKRLTTY